MKKKVDISSEKFTMLFDQVGLKIFLLKTNHLRTGEDGIVTLYVL